MQNQFGLEAKSYPLGISYKIELRRNLWDCDKETLYLLCSSRPGYEVLEWDAKEDGEGGTP